ncbi:hypothetical protein SDC9_194617 [bioreactor metagenome]|uniref:Uncharacterized protein n=1 Tax=bioreactor metagenome TaxID=1076179 RepID=A0A645I6Q6_9ZZZZ
MFGDGFAGQSANQRSNSSSGDCTCRSDDCSGGCASRRGSRRTCCSASSSSDSSADGVGAWGACNRISVGLALFLFAIKLVLFHIQILPLNVGYAVETNQ